MLNKGCSEEELFSFFSQKKREDLDHNYILSSMCTIPHPVAVRAHCMFMETNLGDPGLFPGTASLEKLLIERLGTLFQCETAGGYATSGGTESNIQALRLAKVLKKDIVYPNIVVPESAHFSFKKACDLLCLEMRTVSLGTDFRMDAQKAAEQIDRNTVCLVGIAGTTEYGMVVAGTRPGAPVVGALAVLDYLGTEGMKAIVSGCMKNTQRLIAGMETFGIPRVITPDVNVATFSCREAPGAWRVSWTRQGHMRIVCMPHVSSDRIEAFLSDIGELYA